MLEIMMHEWHVPWDYIDIHWTHRQIRAFAEAMSKRLKASHPAQRRTSGRGGQTKEVVENTLSIPIKKRKRVNAS